MVGAGKAEGAMDAGNMLKPALARGELHCIGATTPGRIPQIHREGCRAGAPLPESAGGREPSVETTIAILRGLQEKYELHHGVDITDPAIVAAAELSPPLHHRPLPAGQGVDLIDEAAARIKMEIDPAGGDGQPDRRLIQLKIEREAVKSERTKPARNAWA